MSVVDVDAVEKIIAEVAATEIMPRFRKLTSGDIEMKGVNDPVTVADKAAEASLIARLTDYLPGSVVVGEESFAADENIISHFSGTKYVWVIDPIDGTRNFISGSPEFGTMVALVREKEAVASWIHDPNTGDSLVAEQGGGVWLRGKRMQLASQNSSTPLGGIVGSRLQRLLAKPEYAVKFEQLPKFEIGSAAAFDYARLFSGDTVFASSIAARTAFLLYRQSKAWDHVPGLFMLSEAGGYAADLRGNPYDMENSMNGLLVSPSREAWAGLFEAFKPVIDVFLSR